MLKVSIMKTISAFLKLIRWPNLVFIALTQFLFYYCIGNYAYGNNSHNLDAHQFLSDRLFLALVTSSIFIAAGGYIINDYFDLQIDSINKPEKIFIEKMIKRRWAIVWHLILSVIGILLSGYISYKTGKWIIGIANAATVLLLWLYSTTFKKKLLIGNIIIALLSAWVVIVVYFFKGATLLSFEGWNAETYPFNVRRFYKLTILYAGFAFIISLIREVLKDLEDKTGDAQFNCKTMPIQWGVPATKVFIGVWIFVCSSLLFILQIYAWQTGCWLSAIYCTCLIIIPLLIILRKLYQAATPKAYHQLSTQVKLVMLAGILSMLFFNWIS